MRVLHVNAICGIGCIGRMIADLHALLIAQGHQSTVAFGRFTANNCSPAIRIGNRLSTYLHGARTRLFDAHGFGSAAATRAFLTRVRAFNPNLIHLHNLHGYFLHVGLLFEYLKQVKVPVVWTLHDCWAFTGHCSHFDFVGCGRWKSECHHCPSRLEYPASLFLDRSQQNHWRKRGLFTGLPDVTIVTPSNWLAGLVKESFLREYPSVVVNHGIDLTVFKPTLSDFRKRHNLEGRFVLLGIAFTWQHKGLSYFAALAKQLHPDEKIVLVGVTRREMRGLPQGILGLPRTDSAAELAEIYSAADVFVNPTLEEVLGAVNLESLACGTPVVTFNTGGSPECLDARCGLVVERGDVPRLVAAVAAIRSRGKDAYAAACRKRAVDYYDKNARLAEYLELYNAMARHRREPGFCALPGAAA